MGPLSTFLLAAPLWIEPRASGSWSKYANHFAMLPLKLSIVCNFQLSSFLCLLYKKIFASPAPRIRLKRNSDSGPRWLLRRTLPIRDIRCSSDRGPAAFPLPPEPRRAASRRIITMPRIVQLSGWCLSCRFIWFGSRREIDSSSSEWHFCHLISMSIEGPLRLYCGGGLFISWLGFWNGHRPQALKWPRALKRPFIELRLTIHRRHFIEFKYIFDENVHHDIFPRKHFIEIEAPLCQILKLRKLAPFTNEIFLA